MATTKPDTGAASAADTSTTKPAPKSKTSTAKKSKPTPAEALEGILRAQWARTVRGIAHDLAHGGDLTAAGRALAAMADDLKTAGKAVAQ